MESFTEKYWFLEHVLLDTCSTFGVLSCFTQYRAIGLDIFLLENELLWHSVVVLRTEWSQYTVMFHICEFLTVQLS